MALTPYSFCPCGSGKKFRFCCQPIHEKISKAFRQDEGHQYDAALRTMDEVTDEHSDNPEAWGRKAQLLYQMDKANEAREALDKAFQLNPEYPFGHFLSARFRQYEGDLAGSLAELRLAAKYYHPEAKDTLANIYSTIADSELGLRRPVAARAALEIGRRLLPNEAELPVAIEKVFGAESPFPASVRKQYALQTPDENAPADVRKSWKNAVEGATTGKLDDAHDAFKNLTETHPELPPAWFNLGLVLAWLGKNEEALEALDRYVSLETDDQKAADAWELAELLRFGQGMEDHADYVNHYHIIRLKEFDSFIDLLEKLEQENRFVGGQVHEESGQLHGIILEKVESLVPGQPASRPPRRAASLTFVQGIVSLANVNAELVQQIAGEIQQRIPDAIHNASQSRGAANFLDVIAEGLVFPLQAKSADESREITTKNLKEYFEERWIHRPLHSLNGVPPIDAVGSFTLRKKLLGVIQFLENTVSKQDFPYDFDSLRRKVDLIPGADAQEVKQIWELSASELAELNVDDLEWDKTEQAFQTALKLDARELAGRFAERLISRPVNSENPDRFPWYRHLIQLSLDHGDSEKAYEYLEDGERFDCEQNEGRRRNDYELRRGQLHVKCGEFDKAEDVFQRLFERDPDDFQRRGSAIETLLSAGQGSVALRFAEAGIEHARKHNNGDAEHYLMDLRNAAQKQVSQ